MRRGHRLSALLVCLGLIAGHAAAVCAGWAPTAEARMSCCVEGPCPMHRGESHESQSARQLTQAEADNCCAVSEGENSSPSAPTLSAAISFAVLERGTGLPAGVPTLVLSDDWRIATPIPASPHIARHVLLSVFLV